MLLLWVPFWLVCCILICVLYTDMCVCMCVCVCVGMNAAAVGLILASVFKMTVDVYKISPFPYASLCIGLFAFTAVDQLQVSLIFCHTHTHTHTHTHVHTHTCIGIAVHSPVRVHSSRPAASGWCKHKHTHTHTHP